MILVKLMINIFDFSKVVILADNHSIGVKAESYFLSLAAHFTGSWKSLDNQDCSTFYQDHEEQSWLFKDFQESVRLAASERKSESALVKMR